tara:strand:+ start:788 stop:1651 length:864 start_codon:yes stop_codon:yes gene_type:complete
MNNIKYFFQYIILSFLFIIFRLLGIKKSSIISGKILCKLGPLFRSNSISYNNLSKAFPNLNDTEKKIIVKNMWFNYGRILSEYVFIKNFRYSEELSKNIIVENQSILEQIKKNDEPVIFISGHFNNFELMAMHIEKSGIDLAAIYRPLNNKYLNPTMEKIRKNYICKKQIKKGLSGTKEILRYFKDGTSVALMIDQRVSEGIKCNFFNNLAFTTTIPAQFVKKFQAKIVPVYIERKEGHKFKIKFYDFLEFSKEQSIESITVKLNEILEKMIVKNPDQWIWSHNRWK